MYVSSILIVASTFPSLDFTSVPTFPRVNSKKLKERSEKAENRLENDVSIARRAAKQERIGRKEDKFRRF